jgi:hypothetical protein
MQRRPLYAAAACLAAAAIGAPAAAQAADSGAWSHKIDRPLTARQLGLSAHAGPKALARAAIDRSANALGLRGSRGGLRFANDLTPKANGAKPLSVLRFQQSLDGLRVLWSQIDVAVAPGRVTSIGATTVRVKSDSLQGRRRISAARARAIAQRVVAGPDSAMPAQLVAYAGEPGKPRAPRRAWVVQVTPANEGSEEQRSLCIVVDAESGKLLARWWGTAAAKPDAADHAPRGLRTANPSDVMYQLTNDAIDDTAHPDYPYGVTYHTRQFTGAITGFGQPPSATLDTLGNYLFEIGSFICNKHDYCGRDGAFDGSVNRFFTVGNFKGSSGTSYNGTDEHVRIETVDHNKPGTIAHEIGHVMDYHYRDDFIGDIRSQEVSEALADMFSYDFTQDRSGAYAAQGAFLQAPHFYSNPDDGGLHFGQFMSQYNCSAKDEHTNSTILSYAYYGFVHKVGHLKAGTVLQYIPYALPGLRRFSDVNFWFVTRAGELYGPDVRLAAQQAFAGIQTPNCPPPPPNTDPIVCKKKPELCDTVVAPPPPAEESRVRD